MNLPMPIGAKFEVEQHSEYGRIRILVNFIVPKMNHSRQIQAFQPIEISLPQAKEILLKEFWRKRGAI